ncbi:EAL domain-containing protein [Phyllobacterium sp. SB3]|uniref:EAL domain-containing protein n=1 Tax=Phyllobacterium sp. SB3 TaxID=3156073 RepID=UPI0032AF7285
MDNMETESRSPQDTTHEYLFGIPVVAVIGLPLLMLLIVLFLGFGLILQTQRADLTTTYAKRTAEFLARDLANQLDTLVTSLQHYGDNLSRRIKAAGCKTPDCVFNMLSTERAVPVRVPPQVSVLRFGGANGHLFGIYRTQETDRDFKGVVKTELNNPSRLVITEPGLVIEEDHSLFARGWYQGGTISKAPFWSAPYIATNTSDLCAATQGSVWSMSRVLRIDGPDRKPLGVLTMDMCINRIATFLQGATGETVHEIAIFTPSGEKLSVSHGQFTIQQDPKIIAMPLRNAVSLDQYGLKGWRVVVTLGQELAAQVAWDWYYTAVCIAGLLISIALTALAASFVVKPLMKLSRAVTDVGDLKLDTPIAISTGIREIGLLASVIEQMRSVLHRNQTRLEFLACHDPVTGFFNRAGLARAFDLASTRQGQIDLILVKVCNGDRIAGIFGDAVLTRLLVNRINTARTMFEGGVVGCLNNNRIACIFQSEEGTDIARMQQVLAAMRLPYEDNGIRILPNVAGSVSSKHGQTEIFDCLLRRANGALHYAEETQSEDAVWYNPALIQDLRAVLDFGGDITQAIARGEFAVEYQPIVELRTGRIFEAQASAVWHHPEFGEIRSHTFIPILERNGSIRHLGLFVMSRAFEFLHRFKLRSPGKRLLISVKLSFAQLMDPLFIERVTELQAEWKVMAPEVNFIITQNMAMLEEQHIFRVMRNLRRLGFSLTIDQFTMAHSTINGVTALQYDGMMIGPDVYRGIEQPGVERIILEAACELARKLGMERIAVGIDNHAIIEPLIECGCTSGRGPWFGKSSDEQVFMARYDENAAMFAAEVVS